ncbi:hypothetical protein [Shimia thalassica]|uniref:hypothetical protein n=1 Tax=Shimia thalassica TaxID=1715693 RepID=UPI0026E44037|nr:hypothetical protein [Shimia thalassica]MDO6799727.1 hypothetical protein [Shimia thalassica]
MKPIEFTRCSFERFRADLITRHEFSIPCFGSKLSILDVWNVDLSRFCAAPSARLSHLSFEGDRAFPTQ